MEGTVQVIRIPVGSLSYKKYQWVSPWRGLCRLFESLEDHFPIKRISGFPHGGDDTGFESLEDYFPIKSISGFPHGGDDTGFESLEDRFLFIQ